MRFVVSGFVLAVFGCRPTTSATPKPAPAVAVLPDVPFAQLDHEQRMQFMKQQVEPAMKPLFQRHDPEKYAEFGCKTCHGEGAEADNWETPVPSLPALDFGDLGKHEPNDLEWMKAVIQPAMARLLREPEYSTENPDGFGCTHCHPIGTR